MYKFLLHIMVWLLVVGGVFSWIMALIRFIVGAAPAAYGVMAIGSAIMLLASAVTILILDRVKQAPQA